MRFVEAMDDDFNTALAIGHLFDGVRAINRLLAEEETTRSSQLLTVVEAGQRQLLRLGEVLGLFRSAPAIWLEGQRSVGLIASGIDPEAIEALILARKEARKNKDFAGADAIRDELAAKGIILLDSPQGTSWKVK